MSLNHLFDGREPHYLRNRAADLKATTPAARAYLPPRERTIARRQHINACETALGLPLTVWPADELEGDET